MRIISKTYILVGVLITLAIINLLLLFQIQQVGTDESYSIIRAGDLKVNTETISSLSASIASGNEQDKEILQLEITNFEHVLSVLKNGGTIRGQGIVTIPKTISAEYDNVYNSWNSYQLSASNVEGTSVFDIVVVNALNYVQDKNGELILLTDSVSKELERLDRDYTRHKEIALDMKEHSKDFGRQALLISIGEEKGVREEIKKSRIGYEIDLRKLVGDSVLGLPAIDEEHVPETLINIPRENSNALRQLEPLWDTIQLRLKTLEENSLLAPEFESARLELYSQKLILQSSIDDLLDSWNAELNKDQSQQQIIVQILLGVDIFVFFVVLYTIRQSLSPLQIITTGLSRVKEGMYGEKIDYKADNEVGDLVNSFNIMSDTIKQKELEAKKMDIAKDEFLAMITHELKTPLVPIQGYADLLLSEHLGELTTIQKERLTIIKDSATSLLDIISDLLDVQKLELGQLRLMKENISIKKSIEKAIESFKPKVIQDEIKLALNSPDIIVTHDPERIAQVISNLIKNSITAVKPKTGVIQVNVEELPTEVKISVNDNGTGIPIDKRKDLFTKFYQVDTTLTRERAGSGLGLAICKGIVKNHGGKIWVESTPNVGSTFIFTIPKTLT
ncbi:MAG: HAMP domain-containing histidine kinase [Thaumarchaeota archaeon]|nr:HAMP domain-containing histidine kinase [Nitrososphaerota archaeon]